MRRPNFFIVGAPRCGTTSLYEYLWQHPEVHVSLTDHGILYGDYVGRVLEGAFKRLSGTTSGSRARVLF